VPGYKYMIVVVNNGGFMNNRHIFVKFGLFIGAITVSLPILEFQNMSYLPRGGIICALILSVIAIYRNKKCTINGVRLH
jgi:type III secretory pathway component EscT